MNIRQKFTAALLATLFAAAACSGKDDDKSLTASPAFGTGTDANSIKGTINALAGTCPSVTFALEARTIKTDANTAFGEGGCAALKNSARVEVVGTVQADGSVKASRVALIATVTPPNPPTVPPPTVPPTTNVVSVAGTVAALAGTCPATAFTIENRKIVTTATTTFGDGGCAALKNGVRVELTGTVQTDGSITALKVAVARNTDTPPPPPTPVPNPIVNIVGGVKSLAGACPTISFVLENRPIKTNAATTFGDGGCAAIKNDARVEISGTVQADGSVLALKMAIVVPPTAPPPTVPPPTPLPPTTATISGTVTGLSGVCPQLVITVGERKVTTTAATVFDGKSCGDLTVGTSVEIAVVTTAAANTAFVALKVIARK